MVLPCSQIENSADKYENSLKIFPKEVSTNIDPHQLIIPLLATFKKVITEEYSSEQLVLERN